MTIGDLMGTIYPSDVTLVTLTDEDTGEILFSKMRLEGFCKLVNPELPVYEWSVSVGKPMRIKHSEEPRPTVILEIVAPVMTNVPDYYTDAEWEALQAGTLEE